MVLSNMIGQKFYRMENSRKSGEHNVLTREEIDKKENVQNVQEETMKKPKKNVRLAARYSPP